MRASAIVIVHIREKYVAQVSLAEDDDMIEAFPSYRANQAFNMSILPWRPWRGWSVANAHGAKSPFEYPAVEAVAVVDDKTRRGLPAAGLGKLMGNPFRRRMRRHAQPQDLASAVLQNQQGKPSSLPSPSLNNRRRAASNCAPRSRSPNSIR
jgi:hypothetical protein